MKDAHSAVKIASIALVCGLVIAGCSGGDAKEAPTTAPSGGTTQTSPTEEPTTEAPPVEPPVAPEVDGVVDLSDPAAGIVFTNLPDATGAEAAAVNAYMAFEVAYWESLRTNVVSGAFVELAIENVAADVVARVDNQVANEVTLGGTSRFSLRVDITQEDYAWISACGSDVDVTAIYPDRTIPVIDTGGSATYRVNAELVAFEGAWLVQEYWIDEEVCSVEESG